MNYGFTHTYEQLLSARNALNSIAMLRWPMRYRTRSRSRFTVRPQYTRKMLMELHVMQIEELIRIVNNTSKFNKRHYLYVKKQLNLCKRLIEAGEQRKK